MHVKLQKITPMSVQNSIVIGEVFQIEVSDGPVHSFETTKTKLVSILCAYEGTSF